MCMQVWKEVAEWSGWSKKEKEKRERMWSQGDAVTRTESSASWEESEGQALRSFAACVSLAKYILNALLWVRMYTFLSSLSFMPCSYIIILPYIYIEYSVQCWYKCGEGDHVNYDGLVRGWWGWCDEVVVVGDPVQQMGTSHLIAIWWWPAPLIC